MNSIKDSALSVADRQDLAVIAGTMVPADATLGIPGADDPAILADMEKSIGRDLPLIREALAAIARKADGAFTGLDQDRREALVNDWYKSGGAAAVMLGRLVLGAYYRDDRVLVALGLEARPPFPKGYILEQGDWSLLDPVRGRAPLWRDDRAELSGER
ncbi:hypothetical protein [Reyranella sp.]|uniref:hypothetical protein n=1 Tax=Reyranella sp. TaxID=1929291 RepID=UPI003784B9D4